MRSTGSRVRGCISRKKKSLQRSFFAIVRSAPHAAAPTQLLVNSSPQPASVIRYARSVSRQTSRFLHWTTPKPAGSRSANVSSPQLHRPTALPSLMLPTTYRKPRFFVHAEPRQQRIPKLGRRRILHRLEFTASAQKLTLQIPRDCARSAKLCCQLFEVTPDGSRRTAVVIPRSTTFPWRGLMIESAATSFHATF